MELHRRVAVGTAAAAGEDASMKVDGAGAATRQAVALDPASLKAYMDEQFQIWRQAQQQQKVAQVS